MYQKFFYKGPLYRFGKYVGYWSGETWAYTLAKAKSNLANQVYRKYGGAYKIDRNDKYYL